MSNDLAHRRPTILPIGDSALLVRFANRLSDQANAAALRFTRALDALVLEGVLEVAPNLVSVLVRYDPDVLAFRRLAGELQLVLSAGEAPLSTQASWLIEIVYDGPDLSAVADMLKMDTTRFIARHQERSLRVLSTGFAPGFVYCGLHDDDLVIPRRATVWDKVPAGSVLFAAGQTAVTATEVPTGWHVIGSTSFRNFDAAAKPPTQIHAGDIISFVAK